MKIPTKLTTKNQRRDIFSINKDLEKTLEYKELEKRVNNNEEMALSHCHENIENLSATSQLCA